MARRVGPGPVKKDKPDWLIELKNKRPSANGEISRIWKLLELDKLITIAINLRSRPGSDAHGKYVTCGHCGTIAETAAELACGTRCPYHEDYKL